MLDLSALEERFNSEPGKSLDSGKPLMLALSLIDEDPDQPRKEFDEQKLKELADDVAIRGVKQPVSVRPHPMDEGRWMLNFGARRFRASKLAGLDEIPAFVDETADDYAQVAENEQRENLSPMSVALFIDKRLKKGDKKKDIARQIGKPVTGIAEYLALLHAPPCIDAVYRNGRTSSVRTLYELSVLHKDFPEQVEIWLQDPEQEVSRRTVGELTLSLRTPPALSNTVDEGASLDSESLRHDEASATNLRHDEAPGAEAASVNEVPFHNPDIEKGARPASVSDPSLLKKPLLLGNYDGRAVMLLLNRRPSQDGLIFIRYEDNGQDVEVDITQVSLNLLTASTN